MFGVFNEDSLASLHASLWRWGFQRGAAQPLTFGRRPCELASHRRNQNRKQSRSLAPEMLDEVGRVSRGPGKEKEAFASSSTFHPLSIHVSVISKSLLCTSLYCHILAAETRFNIHDQRVW